MIVLDFKDFCTNDNDGGYKWEKTPVRASVVKDCPENKTGVILLTRSCIYSMNSGGKDNLQQNSLFKLLKNLPFWILLVKALK